MTRPPVQGGLEARRQLPVIYNPHSFASQTEASYIHLYISKLLIQHVNRIYLDIHLYHS